MTSRSGIAIGFAVAILFSFIEFAVYVSTSSNVDYNLTKM